jgi:serine/threonine protein kinase
MSHELQLSSESVTQLHADATAVLEACETETNLHNNAKSLSILVCNALASIQLQVDTETAAAAAAAASARATVSECASWLRTCWLHSQPIYLAAACTSVINATNTMEEHLLGLEEACIDAQSELRKAKLGSRVRSRANMSSSPNASSPLARSAVSTFFSEPTEDILLRRLADADHLVKKSRQVMRTWNREVRKIALEFVPELFHDIPDLLLPGSVMGDGGFAEMAHVPRRIYGEYTMEEDKRNDTTKRLILRGKRANTDESIMLKMFHMNEAEQRRELERELSALGHLRRNMTNMFILSCTAVVDGCTYDVDESKEKMAVYVEYPIYTGGNLTQWLAVNPRLEWEQQNMGRQLLGAMAFVHDHGIVHNAIRPSNILLSHDGRPVLSDFEQSKFLLPELGIGIGLGSFRGGSFNLPKGNARNFVAPEIVSSGVYSSQTHDSDMYSFGVLLYYIYISQGDPDCSYIANLLPCKPELSSSMDLDCGHLITRLMSYEPSSRPSAASSLQHVYFRKSFVELMNENEGNVDPDRKNLGAVRGVLRGVRHENRTNVERFTVARSNIGIQVLEYFKNTSLDRMKAPLRITFEGESGVDEGGLLSELLTLFYDEVLDPEFGLFQGVNDVDSKKDSIGDIFYQVLPSKKATSPGALQNLRAFGRCLLKTVYEGRRAGSALSPSLFKYLTGTAVNIRDLHSWDPVLAKSLSWVLNSEKNEWEHLGLHFEDVGEAELGLVTETTKEQYIVQRINNSLIDSRKVQLMAVKSGFTEAMFGLSPDAAPFLSLLSHADWKTLLRGDADSETVSAQDIINTLKFTGFPTNSYIPQWFKEIILNLPENKLREFLIFTTGAPTLPSGNISSAGVDNFSSSTAFELLIRCQPDSTSLPTAHTCFFHLDVPMYDSQEILASKLDYAVSHTRTFDIV